jgi:MSHA biogenesis protein MshP
MRNPFRRVAGFALMLAIFMIVTLAAIAVYLVTISTGQLEAATQDEQGARAYQAARTGLDWGAYQLLRNGAFCAASTTLPLTQGLAGFSVEVACQQVGVTETDGGAQVSVYRVTATGCNQSPCGSAVGPTYVERQLQLTVTVETNL